MENGLTDKAEIERLKDLLRAREGKPGFGQNVIALKARLAELQGRAPADG